MYLSCEAGLIASKICCLVLNPIRAFLIGSDPSSVGKDWYKLVIKKIKK